MAVEGIVVAKEAHQQDRAIEVIKPLLDNPLVVGLGLLALNNALFVNGAYNWTNEHPRSILGGPVWFELGTPQNEAEAYWTRLEAFIMTITALQAAGGLGENGIGGLIRSLKGG